MIYMVIAVVACVAYLFYKHFKKRRIEYFPACEASSLSAYADIECLHSTYQIPEVSLVVLNPEKISYIQTKSQLNSIIPNLSKSSHIGIDIEESRENSYIGYICLIQISTLENIYLIDTLKLRSEILLLKPIFSNSLITKIFHGAHNDTQWLYRDFGIVCVNVFDTQIAGKFLGLKKLGLNYLWKKYCKFVMASEYKKKMQTSRWDLRPLSKEQIVYGAQDAAYLLYLMKVLIGEMSDEMIRSMREETNKICMKKFTVGVTEEKCLTALRKHSTQAIDSQSKFIFTKLFTLRDETAARLNKGVSKIIPIETLLSLSFDKPTSAQSLNQNYPPSPFLNQNSSQILAIINQSLTIPFEIFRDSKSSNSRQEKKQQRYQNFLDKYTIKKKVYENCQIQAPDGEILCFADTKKANWYLVRNLADIVQTDPLIIKLNFEPNGRGFSDVEADQIYYSKEKKNQCVSCGSTSTYLKYHVVPLLYRQFFPENYKSHRSHDVVLLCAVCHEIANKHSDVLKKKIAKEFGVSLSHFGEMRQRKEDLSCIKKVSANLVKHGKNMPGNRVEALTLQVEKFIEENPQYSEYFAGKNFEEILGFLSQEENSRALLRVYGDVNWRKELGNAHGKIIVEQLNDLKPFIRRWRAHFIKSLNPKFLPDSWNVEHLLNSPKFP